MKTLLLVLTLILSLSPALLPAQCNQFFEFTNGQKLEYTSYDKKGKMASKEHQEVTMFRETAEGFEMQIETVHFDKKGEETLSSSFDASCADGVYTLDVRNFVNDEMMQAFQGMEVTVEGTALEVPNALKVGQELPSGDCKITAASDNVNLLTLTINIDDRKVTGREKITTPAGTFDCYVIEQVVTSKMILKSTYNSREYVAEKYGPVRVETYNKGGKLVSTRDLTAIN